MCLIEYHTDGTLSPDGAVLWGDHLDLKAHLASTRPDQEHVLVNPHARQTYYFVPVHRENRSHSQPKVYEFPAHRGGGFVMYANGKTVFETEPRYSEILSNLTLPDGRPYRPHLGDKLPDPPPDLDVIDLRDPD